MNECDNRTKSEHHEPLDLNPIWIWIRARQLEESFPGGPEIGAWPTSCNRVLRGWGAVRRSDWSFSPNDAWPPIEPRGLDQLAKQHRHYRYLRVRSADECAKALATGECVIYSSFAIVKQDWFDAPQGYIPNTTVGSQSDGGHCVALVMVDETSKQFAFPNSWGEDWGDRGWGYITYEYFDECFTEAWCSDALKEVLPKYENESGIQFRDWMYYDVFGRPVLGIDVYDWDNDECIGWWFAIDSNSQLEVEEFFVMPEFRRKGYGTGMMNRLLAAARIINKSILIWIPHPDWNVIQQPRTQPFLEKFGFSILRSDVRWSAAKAIHGTATPPSVGSLPRTQTPMSSHWFQVKPGRRYIP